MSNHQVPIPPVKTLPKPFNIRDSDKFLPGPFHTPSNEYLELSGAA